MHETLLSKSYYGNTVQDWLIALLIVLGAVLVGKLLYWAFRGIAQKITVRTKTKLDDILVDTIKKPVSLVATLLGVWYGAETLTFSETVQSGISQVFEIAVIFTAAWLLIRVLEALFTQYLVPMVGETETDLDDQLLPILRTGTKTVIWVLAVIIALDNAGYDVAALMAGLGIGGFALAMAAKDTISNIFGGFTIFTDKPFTLKDRIKVSGYDGVVKEVGLRSTRVETLAGTIVTIPNSTFADSPVENVSLEPSRKVATKLGLTYDTTPEQMNMAMELLRNIATQNPDLEDQVTVAFTEFGDSSMNLNFIYYIRKGSDILAAQTAVNIAVLKEFNSRGLEFAFPTQTLYTKAM